MGALERSARVPQVLEGSDKGAGDGLNERHTWRAKRSPLYGLAPPRTAGKRVAWPRVCRGRMADVWTVGACWKVGGWKVGGWKVGGWKVARRVHADQANADSCW